MVFKVQVGAAQIAIHQGQTVLLTETDGRVNWPSKCGLYFRDTRMISSATKLPRPLIRVMAPIRSSSPMMLGLSI